MRFFRRRLRSIDASFWRPNGWIIGGLRGNDTGKAKLGDRGFTTGALLRQGSGGVARGAGLVDDDVGVGGLDGVNLLDAVEDAFGQGFLVGGFDQDEDVGAAPAGVGALDPLELADGLDDVAALAGTDID